MAKTRKDPEKPRPSLVKKYRQIAKREQKKPH
jgi:hypothetical protein